MKALTLNDKVVQVKDIEFPVHNSLVWVDCPEDVKAGWTYDGENFTASVIEDEVVSKSKDQLYIEALTKAVLLDDKTDLEALEASK